MERHRREEERDPRRRGYCEFYISNHVNEKQLVKIRKKNDELEDE